MAENSGDFIQICENLALKNKDMLYLFAWIQEHANLCKVSSLCPKDNVKVTEGLIAAIRNSAIRGNDLLLKVISQDYTGMFAKNFNINVDYGQKNKEEGAIKKTSQLPLSGGNRFDENFYATNRLKIAQLAPKKSIENHAELKPSKDYSKKKNAS